MTTVAFDGTQPNGQVGFYTYTVADGTWRWSDSVYVLHGYAPHEVPASTEVFLRHKHPDDRVRSYEVLEAAVRDGRTFSCYHRIIDRHDRVRSVLSVGHGLADDAGQVVRVEGFLVDLTDVRRDETQAEVESALHRIAEHRAVIEQAKGMVMVATGCDADAAFDVLRGCSQHVNVKVNDIAQRLVGACAGLGGSSQVVPFLERLAGPTGPRTAVDTPLHQRVGGATPA